MPIGIGKNSAAQPLINPGLPESEESGRQLKKENVADGRKYVYMVLVKTKDKQGEIKTEIKTTDMKFGASSAKSIAKFMSSDEGKAHLAGKTPEQLQRMENYLTLNAYKSQHVINNVLGQVNYKSKTRVVLEKIMHFVINGPFNSSKHYKTALTQLENRSFTPTDHIKSAPPPKKPVSEEDQIKKDADVKEANKKWQIDYPPEKTDVPPDKKAYSPWVSFGKTVEVQGETKVFPTNFSDNVFTDGIRRRTNTDKSLKKTLTEDLTNMKNGAFAIKSMGELRKKEGPIRLKEFTMGMKVQWPEREVMADNAKFIQGLVEDICDTELRNPDQKLSCEDFKDMLLKRMREKGTETLELTRQDFLDLAFTENSEGNLEPTKMKNLPPNLQESPVKQHVTKYSEDILEGRWKEGDVSVRSLKLIHITDVDGEIKKVSGYLDTDEFKDVFNKLRNSKKEAEDV